MPSKPTEKSPYQSKFSIGVYVHLGQLIAEMACERAARKEYKELPQKFWEIKKWGAYLKFQLLNASKLRKQFRDDAILAALKDKRCKTVYSLNAPWFIKVIEEYQAVPPKVVTKEMVEEALEIKEVRPSTGGNNLASLLD